jgi:hypothetical protein
MPTAAPQAAQTAAPAARDAYDPYVAPPPPPPASRRAMGGPPVIAVPYGSSERLDGPVEGSPQATPQQSHPLSRVPPHARKTTGPVQV